jgi:hypothetical protein
MMPSVIRDGVYDTCVSAIDSPVPAFAGEPILCRLIWTCLDELAEREGRGVRMLVEFAGQLWLVLVERVVDERLEAQVVIPR